MSLEINGFEILEQFVDTKILDSVKNEVNDLDTLYPKYGIRSADKKFSTILYIF